MAIIYTPIYLLAFLGGVMVRSFFAIPVDAVLVVFGVLFGFSLLMAIRRAPMRWVAIVGVLFFCAGMLRFGSFEDNIFAGTQRELYGKQIITRGTVFFTEIKPNSQRMMMDTAIGRILAVTGPYPRYAYGDTLDVSGVLQEPVAYGAFDTKKILARDRIFSEMIFPEIKRADAHRQSGILYYLFSMKEAFERNIRNILPEPHASLANGMLLGDEGALDRAITDAFRKSGTIHILVLSGYNITIVGIFIMSILGYLFPQYVAWIGSVLGILAFTAMTGSQAPAVRYAIMAIIGLVAFKSGRNHAAIFALLWAAFLMILWNPMTLRWDRGFQLSFLATLGLIVLSPWLQKKFSFLPSVFGIRESGASTIAAQIFVLPLLLSWGSEISVLSPIANILIVGSVPFVMLFGFLGSMIAFATISGGRIFASVSYVLISFQIWVAERIASLPMSSIAINSMPITALICIYIVLFYISIRFYMAQYQHAK